ncbi:MAG TPA: hypothetical protein VJN18_07435 [Polyangiaceae bacterium]|nr:hypothetical protein [Polyangiaceae bacterium]
MFSYTDVQSSEGPTGLERSLVRPTVTTPSLWRIADSRKPRRSAALAERTDRVFARVLGGDERYAAKVALVRRYKRQLRAGLSARSWQLFLKLEEAEIGRFTYALERLVGWAVTQRKRSRRR